MKVQVVIDLDLDNGQYEMQINSKDPKEKKIDQQKLSIIMGRVWEHWQNKFRN